jgi:hypothetical protein
MRSKFSTFILASTALAAAALATLPAVAATSTTLNVPFSFTVGGKSLPAGAYSVQRDNSGNFVRLESKDASHSFMWVAAPSATRGDKVILKFDGQGQTHALQSVQYGPLVTTTLNRKSRKAEEVSAPYLPGL